MKTKILLSFAILFFAAITTEGQITEGKYLLGGAFNFYSSDNPKNNSENVNIQFGKVIKENTVVGVIGSLTGGTNNSSTEKYKINRYSAGVFYRKYKPLGKNFYFLQEIDASFQHSKELTNYFSNIPEYLHTESNGVLISYIPGLSYAVSKKMQIELTMPNLASFSYTHVKTVNSQLPPTLLPQKANNFSGMINLNSNLINNFGLGFKFLLGK
jgi:hypothetical protein